MSFNGAGLFQVNTSGQPVVTGTTISSTVFNALTADLATALSTCVLKDGTQTTTVRVPFLFGINSSLTTDATSITTGSIISAGGISCQKALWVGGLANIAGAVTLQSTLAVTGATTFTAAAVASTSIQSPVLYMGGTTVNDVLISKGATSTAYIRLGDNSGFGALGVSFITLGGVSVNDTMLTKIATGVIAARLGDNSAYAGVEALTFNTSSSIIYLGGTTSSEVSLRRSGTTLLVKKGDNSADGDLTCGVLTAATVAATDLTASGTVDLGGADYDGAISGITNITIVKGVITATS